MGSEKKMLRVDAHDRVTGTEDKEACHRQLLLHRAFSVFIFRNNEMLVTQRSAEKKTWPLFWSNACCSHPREGEDTVDAATRRLSEELGFSCPLEFLFKFEYRARFDKEWGEHELDWVFLGEYDGTVSPDPGEVAAFRFVPIGDLRKDIASHPGRYTPWFRMSVERVLKHRRH